MLELREEPPREIAKCRRYPRKKKAAARPSLRSRTRCLGATRELEIGAQQAGARSRATRIAPMTSPVSASVRGKRLRRNRLPASCSTRSQRPARLSSRVVLAGQSSGAGSRRQSSAGVGKRRQTSADVGDFEGRSADIVVQSPGTDVPIGLPNRLPKQAAEVESCAFSGAKFAAHRVSKPEHRRPRSRRLDR